MKMRQVSIVLAAMLMVAQGKQMIFENRMKQTIWVGTQGNPGHPLIKNGGWALGAGGKTTVNVGDSWQGRVWGRTKCNSQGICETGNCGGIQCQGRGGTPPATLAEFTFGGHAGQDFYDVSLVDGFNIPVSIIPLDKSKSGYRCTAARCQVDINASCPKELRQTVGGRTVGCKSACEAKQTDQYCCRKKYGTERTCRSRDWPFNYPQFFKTKCPDAYSYAYDDQKSTFTCEKTGYKIQFG